jgi:hypothetical protein
LCTLVWKGKNRDCKLQTGKRKEFNNPKSLHYLPYDMRC